MRHLKNFVDSKFFSLQFFPLALSVIFFACVCEVQFCLCVKFLFFLFFFFVWLDTYRPLLYHFVASYCIIPFDMRIFVPTIENGEELRIRVCFSFSFFFVFRAKLGTTNTRQNRLSDIKNKSSFSRNSRRLKNFKKITPSIQRNQFEIFDFWSNFEWVNKRADLI